MSRNTKKRERFVALACALFALAAPLHAEETAGTPYDYLVVDFIDSTHVEFVLSEKPEISFPNGTFVVTQGTEVATYQQANVAGYHFTRVPLAVEKPAKNTVSVQFTDNENVIVRGIDEGAISLYDTAGRRIGSSKCSASGQAMVSLAGAPAGIYVVKLPNGQQFKFLKK